MSALFEIMNGNTPGRFAGVVEWGRTITTPISARQRPLVRAGSPRRLAGAVLVRHLSELYFKGYLGKMLFSGDDLQEALSVLSGGEKVRCMVRMIPRRQHPRARLADQPPRPRVHPGVQQLADQFQGQRADEFARPRDSVNTVANRIIELTPNGMVDRYRVRRLHHRQGRRPASGGPLGLKRSMPALKTKTAPASVVWD